MVYLGLEHRNRVSPERTGSFLVAVERPSSMVLLQINLSSVGFMEGCVTSRLAINLEHASSVRARMLCPTGCCLPTKPMRTEIEVHALLSANPSELA